MIWPLARFVVQDWSMAPAIAPGDRLLVWRWLGKRHLRRGDIVVVRDPEHPRRFLVKRVAATVPRHSPAARDGKLTPRRMDADLVVHGDNAGHSRDSRQFGPVPTALLVGRVIWRYLPEGRRGRLPPGPPGADQR